MLRTKLVRCRRTGARKGAKRVIHRAITVRAFDRHPWAQKTYVIFVTVSPAYVFLVKRVASTPNRASWFLRDVSAAGLAIALPVVGTFPSLDIPLD